MRHGDRSHCAPAGAVLLALGESSRSSRKIDQRVALREEEAREIEGALEAIRAVPEWKHAVDMVEALGRGRVLAAVPTLSGLWRDCPIAPVRHAAGHALFAIGTPAAHEALQSAIELSDDLAAFLAIKSVVVTDPGCAFDRLSPYLADASLDRPGGPQIASAIFCFFQARSPVGVGDEGWIDVPPRVLRKDERWLRRALELRHDRRVEEAARLLLRAVTPAELDEALAQCPLPPPPPAAAPAPTGPRDFLSRYASGEHAAVWHELRNLGTIAHPALREEAAAVAALTMRRVRANVERITDRLRSASYSFDDALPPWSPPAPNVEEQIARIERAAGGPCPIALRAFWSVVGGVFWKHAEDVESASPVWGDLPLAECDPLCIDDAETGWWCVDEWLDERQHMHAEAVGPLFMSLAPDYLHKANISGGAPYGIRLPSELADPQFENESHELPFVDYLRLCFNSGGFSRLDQFERCQDALAFVAMLKKDLEPF
jgi:hypothetical protein